RVSRLVPPGWVRSYWTVACCPPAFCGLNDVFMPLKTWSRKPSTPPGEPWIASTSSSLLGWLSTPATSSSKLDALIWLIWVPPGGDSNDRSLSRGGLRRRSRSPPRPPRRPRWRPPRVDGPAAPLRLVPSEAEGSAAPPSVRHDREEEPV